MNIKEMEQNAKAAASLLRCMANDRRLMILCQLSAGEMSVGALEQVIGLRQSALSQHLARLRHDGLVSTRKDGLHVYYSVSSPHAMAVIDTLVSLYCPPDPT